MEAIEAPLEIAAAPERPGPESGAATGLCRNCAAPLFGAFCSACGQPADTHRRSVLHLLHDVFKDVASFDSRILRTAGALFFRPGELPLAFREGRTQRYVPAVRLYLFVSLIFFLFLSISGTDILQLELTTASQRYSSDASGNVFVEKNGVTARVEGLKADKNGNVFADTGRGGPHVPVFGIRADGVTQYLSANAFFFAPVKKIRGPISAGLEALLKRQHEQFAALPIGSSLKSWMARHFDRILQALATDPTAINGPMTEWIPRVLFVLLPVFACLLALFYWRQRRDFFFVDHLVFSLDMHSFAFAIILAAVILARLIPGGAAAATALMAIGFYLFLAMKNFYKQGWIWTGVKFAGVSFVYSAVFLVPALTGILLASLLYI